MENIFAISQVVQMAIVDIIVLRENTMITSLVSVVL